MSNGWQPSGQQQQQQQGGAYNPYGTPPPAAGPTGGPGYGGPPGGGYPGQKPPTNGKATASLILGIAGCCIIGLLGGIPAMILGFMARREIAESNGRQGGDGMALTGIILGAISIVGSIIMIIFYASIISMIVDCTDNPDAPGCEDFQSRAPVDDVEPTPRIVAPATSAPLFWSGPPSAVASG